MRRRIVTSTSHDVTLTSQFVASRVDRKFQLFSDIFVDQLFEESHFFGRNQFFVAAVAVVAADVVVPVVAAADVVPVVAAAAAVAAGVVPRHPMIKIKRLVDNICMSASTTKNLVWRIKFRLENVLPSFVEKIFSENISKTFLASWQKCKKVDNADPIQSNEPKIWLSLQKCFLKSAKWHNIANPELAIPKSVLFWSLKVFVFHF